MFTFKPRAKVTKGLTIKVYGYSGEELSEHEFNPTPLKLFVFDVMSRLAHSNCQCCDVKELDEIKMKVLNWLWIKYDFKFKGVDETRLVEDIMEEVENGGGYVHFDGRNYNVLETRIFKDGIEGDLDIDTDQVVQAMLTEYKK